ncbi:MAG: NHL repeat-containing protein [Chloroflexota bacterium]
MDGNRFDALMRAAFAAGVSRRGLAAAAAGLLGGRTAAAAKDRKQGSGSGARPAPEGPCPGGPKANRCLNDGACCTGYCAEGVCRCKPNWMECRNGKHCCSGRCIDGRCDGGARPEGSVCRENFNCQDELACIRGECRPSRRARCTPGNCPGCCAGTVCRAGSHRTACGPKRGVCATCTYPGVCLDGICGAPVRCGPASCPNGCCADGVCQPGAAADACGAGGAACAVCPSLAALCTAGTCAAGTWANFTTIGSGVSGAAATEFAGPAGVHVSPEGLMLWVADVNNNRISVWTRPSVASKDWAPHSTISGTSGAGSTDLSLPVGVVATEDGLTTLIADTGNNRVSVWTRTLAQPTTWVHQTNFGTLGADDDQFNSPNGIDVTADGLTVLVVEAANNRVSIWSRPDATSNAWTERATFGSGPNNGKSQFNGPYDVAVSANGLLAWVADAGNSRISWWGVTDQVNQVWANIDVIGAPGADPNQFGGPFGVSVTADTLTMFVADTGNNRISIWNRPDASSAVWSHQAVGGILGTGSAGSADSEFDVPIKVFAAADGQAIWVGDVSNNRISSWTQS